VTVTVSTPALISTMDLANGSGALPD
jgi:hypothetical protein